MNRKTRLKRNVSVFSLGLILLFPTGCAPTVASLDEPEEGESSVTNAPTEAGKEDSNESGPSAMSPTDLEDFTSGDIESRLAEMSPSERTMVTLRFWSITLLFFYSVYDRYPTADEGLEILTNPPPAPDGKTYEPFAQEILLTDGWGRPFVYEPITVGDDLPFFRLKSLGPDGVESDDDMVADLEEVAMEASATITAGGLGD